jgi:hypothetical protein
LVRYRPPCFAIIGATLARYSSNFLAFVMVCSTIKYAFVIFCTPCSNITAHPATNATADRSP